MQSNINLRVGPKQYLTVKLNHNDSGKGNKKFNGRGRGRGDEVFLLQQLLQSRVLPM
jgi:hypothetical protein